MIKFFIDLIQLVNSTAPLLSSIVIFTLLAVLLSNSIKRSAVIYYIVLAIPFVMVTIPFVGRLFGIEMISFGRTPFLGVIFRDYIHFSTFAFPILIIVMYMGALNPKIPWVKKLLKNRKELSIISGFPVLTHALIRTVNNFPLSLSYFTNNVKYMSNAQTSGYSGEGISNFSYVLGILLLIIYLPLWVSSFDAVRKKMGGVRWRKLQKWSYPFYALLFIHAMGLQAGEILSAKEASRQRYGEEVNINVDAKIKSKNKIFQIEQSVSSVTERPNYRRGSGGEGHRRTVGFTDISVNRDIKRYIHIFSLVLIFGSYLYLRLKKANNDKMRRKLKMDFKM